MQFVGLAALGLALLTLLGWATGWRVLITIAPDLPPMRGDAALGIAFLGAAMGLRSRPTLSRVLCGAIALVALGALARKTGAWPGSGAEWLEPMPVETALGLLLAAALLLLDSRKQRTPVIEGCLCALAVLVAWIGLHGLTDIAVRALARMPLAQETMIAAQTALILVAAGAALFYRTVSESEQKRQQWMSWIPLIGFLVAVSIPLSTERMLTEQQARQAGRDVEQARDLIVENIRRGVNEPVLALQRMAERASLYFDPWRGEEWLQDANHLLRDYPALYAIALTDRATTILKRAPATPVGREGMQMPADLSRRVAFAEALGARAPRMSRAVTLVNGSVGTVVVAPAFARGAHVGYVAASAQFARLLELVVSGVSHEYDLRVLEDGLLIYGRGPNAPQIPEALMRRAALRLHGTTWQIEVWPGAEALDDAASPIPLIVLSAGVLTALLIALALHMALLANLQKRRAEQSNDAAHRAELALRASHQRFEGVSRATSDAIWDWDVVNNTLWWNEGFENLFGFAPSQVEPGIESWIERIHPDDRERVVQSRRAVLDSGARQWSAEYRFARSDGGWTDVSDHGLVIVTDGQARRMVGGMTDISEKKKAERLVRDRDRFFQVSLELLMIATPQGGLIEVNPAAEKVLGWSRDEFLTMNYENIIHPDNLPVARGVLRRLVKGEAIDNFECRSRCKSGHYLWLQWSVAPAEDGALYCAGREVGARKAAETRMRQAYARLEAGNQELQDFAFVAARDLQEPLRRIRTFLARLGARERSAAHGESGDDYARVEHAAQRMQALLNGLTTYARISRETRPFTRITLDELVRTVLDDLAPLVAASQARVEVGALPVIHGDATQLRQLLTTLIGYGMQFRRAGHWPQVRIGASPLPVESEGAVPMANIVIEDRAMPIDARLAQAGDHGARGRGVPLEDTGMAMAIVRRIVARHGGAIVAHLDPQRGSRFEVRLPLHPEAAPAAAQPDSAGVAARLS